MPLTTRTVTGRVSLANAVDESITRIRFTPSKASYEEAQGAVVTPEHFYAIPDGAGDISIPLFPTDISQVQTFYTVAAGSFVDGRERFQSIGRMFLPSTGSTNIADLLEPADGVTVATINDMQVLLAQAQAARDTVVSIASTFTSGLTFRGSLADVANLPLTAELGDAYEINGDWWAWDGTEFDNIGPVRGEDGEQGPIGPEGPEGPTPVGALIDTNNLSDVADPAIALSNIGGQPQSANLDDFSGKAAPAGDVVGTTDAQTLTNKTLTSPILDGAVTGDAIATQAEAEAGTVTDQLMTPLRTAQAIAALATGGGFIARAEAADSATIEFTAFDASSFDAYVFDIANLVPGTDNVNFLVRFSTDGGVTWEDGASEYTWSVAGVTASTTRVTGAANANAITLNHTVDPVGNASGEDGVCGVVNLARPDLLRRSRLVWSIGYIDSGAQNAHVTGSGEYKTASAINGIQFLFSSGNISSGTITMTGRSSS